MKEIERPYIILSCAMTIDGKIASKIGDTELSDEIDWREVHKLRSKVDAILVGKGTIIKDNPKLHIKFVDHQGYYRLVVDSNLSIPIDAQVIKYKPDLYPTIIITTENIKLNKVAQYEKAGVKIIKSGKQERVDIIKLMPLLYQKGIHKILLEGGGNLNWSFIKAKLVDELRITIAPWIIGGENAVSIVEGDGFLKMIECPRFRLIETKQWNNYITLFYEKDYE
ncbi:MAG: 2,5-diamino-6-(ribosylamino)-4(3H)-pyrimidinone 5'-phosphate reductase [Candidatus Lokiarchaeota archaeon]|nr:2,5-diamino-6-(ribosylamino)-4(3H)-pyrimidinone 5'-phosphate reductase [Candidatus Lokiarchaeota archaeon]